MTMPEASPMRAMTHWRVLSAMFIPKLLRQRHLARGIEELQLPAAGERRRCGQGWSQVVKKALTDRNRPAARRAAHNRRRRSRRVMRALRSRASFGDESSRQGEGIQPDFGAAAAGRAQARRVEQKPVGYIHHRRRIGCEQLVRRQAEARAGDRPRPAALAASPSSFKSASPAAASPRKPTTHNASPGPAS